VNDLVAFAAIVFVLPLALLVCAGIASGGVSPWLRNATLVLLAPGALLLRWRLYATLRSVRLAADRRGTGHSFFKDWGSVVSDRSASGDRA
jgi:hypothetical protein